MKSRILGIVCGGLLGAVVGMGTGIVGGIFGAVAGVLVFISIGSAWGFSAGPDIARLINRFRRE